MSSLNPPHLLYVAWGYPPSRGGGVYRALATPNAFARAGWRVTVLTASRETFLGTTGADLSLEKEIDPSITVRRVPFDVPSYQTDLRRWSGVRARYPELWNVWRARRDASQFPERVYGGWRTPLDREAQRINRESPVDLVLGTANPNVDFAPGLSLSRSHAVPYILDYRDAWQLDVFTGERITRPGSEVAKLEAELVAGASEVWFVNEPIRVWHEAVYPQFADKLHVVSNGYDADFAHFTDRVRPRAELDRGLVFGYIGTISAKVPIRELLEGWRRARTKSELLARSTIELYGYLDFVGIPNEELLSALAEFEGDGVRYGGPVSKATIAQTYESFDVLLLVLGAGKYVTSGKVFEYTATGLPVLSIHEPGNAATDVLREYPQWIATGAMDSASIADTLLAGADRALSLSADDRRAAQDWAVRYERGNQLHPRIESLTTLADANRRRSR